MLTAQSNCKHGAVHAGGCSLFTSSTNSTRRLPTARHHRHALSNSQSRAATHCSGTHAAASTTSCSPAEPEQQRFPALPCTRNTMQTSSAEQPGSGWRHCTPQGALASACLAAALAALTALQPTPAWASNVRLRDVENPEMQAGLRAATQGRWGEAERRFRAVLADDAASASAWSNLGNVHLSQGRASEALSDFTRAVALAPDAPVPYLNRALAAEQLGVQAAQAGSADDARKDYDLALQDCEEAIARDPGQYAAWFNRGNVLGRLDRWDAALASYTRAADLAPGIAGYRLREAELLFQQGQPDAAAKLARSVSRKYANYAEAHAVLAALEWARGSEGAAESHFEAAQQIDGRWGDWSFIEDNTRWPPKLYDAMRRFLATESSAN